MWIIAPSISIIVILIISQIGSYVWGNKPIINEASIITYNQSSQTLDVATNMALFNNKRSDMKINWDKSDNLEFLNHHNYFDDGEQKVNKMTGYAYYFQNEPVFYSYKTQLWDYMDAKAKKTIKVDDKGSSAEIINEGDDSILKFKNGLPMNFKQCILYRNAKFYELGAINSGEESSINLSTAKSYVDLYQVTMPEEELHDLYESEEMIRSITQNDSSFNNIYIFGFNYEPIGYKIKINDEEPKEFARNLVCMKMDLKLKDGANVKLTESEIGGQFFSTYVDRKSEIKEDSFNRNIMDFEYYNAYQGDRPMTDIDSEFDHVNAIISEYRIPENIDVNSIEMDFSISTESSLGSNNLNANQVKDEYYIYNFKTDEYDKVTFDAEVSKHYLDPKIKKIDLQKYMSETGDIKTLTIKDDAFMNKWYEIKKQGLTIKGVYHD